MLRVISVLFLLAFCVGSILADELQVTNSVAHSNGKQLSKQKDDQEATDSDELSNGKQLSGHKDHITSATSDGTPLVSSPDGQALQTNNSKQKPQAGSTGLTVSNEGKAITTPKQNDEQRGSQNQQESGATSDALVNSGTAATAAGPVEPTSTIEHSGAHGPIPQTPSTNRVTPVDPNTAQSNQNTEKEHTGTSGASSPQRSANNDKMETGAPPAENGGLAKGSCNLGSIINLASAVLLIGFAPRYI